MPRILAQIFQMKLMILAVAHREFLVLSLCPSASQVVYDIKSVLAQSDGSL
jgi:hypothetical protein